MVVPAAERTLQKDGSLDITFFRSSVLRFPTFYLQQFHYDLHEKCYFSLPVRYVVVDSKVQGQAGLKCVLVFRVLKHSPLTLAEEAG